MWPFWGLSFYLLTVSNADVSPYFFCADMNPQQHVSIEQLMGMWYGIEIINHQVEDHYVRIGKSCPVLHLTLSKDYPTTTYNPLYKNYNYGYNYGERRPPHPRPTDRNPNYDQYERATQGPYYRNYNERRYGSKFYNPRDYPYEMRRLRIWWDENGSETEYQLKYNTSKPGFWISAGPQNGSELEPLYSSFAGTVQVIKAVGSHLVLTFCHQLPDRQLFTILLSRERKLSSADIHGVHSLLNRKGLNTRAIKKVCWNGSNTIQNSLFMIILLLFGVFVCQY
ncbi:uncharacterized protein LOC103314838 [Tribolium castaneum]|nr:PREDICTED: uncharacterized protein LOC103314838 [Tribolium castaneum]|eukprot:XP_008200112.1 PREDICTED: uncharacterized protein LOC103314838 [Tribolium castaneum]